MQVREGWRRVSADGAATFVTSEVFERPYGDAGPLAIEAHRKGASAPHLIRMMRVLAARPTLRGLDATS